MCLAAIATAQHAHFPFLLASNRDEFFDRAAAPLAWWQPAENAPRVLSGRDLSAGGTWLGVSEAGRLALVTNVREPGRVVTGAPSRGALVPRWLCEPHTQAQQLQDMARVPRNGFNFLAADLRAAQPTGLWCSNRAAAVQRLGAGVFGLSNAALDTPWPKVVQLKQRLAEAVTTCTDVPSLVTAAYAALADGTPAVDAALPATGVPLARERALSSAFIRIQDGDTGAVYGTRCATVVVVCQEARRRVVRVFERSFGRDGAVSGEREESLVLD